MFKIIVNCGRCERFIRECLDSVLSQSFTDWEAFVTVDPCGDKTFAQALKVKDPRIGIKRNFTRRYSLRNQIDAIRESGAEPEDVIVSLDGDDYFAQDDALWMIADAYAKSGCWMTYGSWIPNAAEKGLRAGMWPAYPEGTTDFRHERWLGTAVRTWKRWLWDRVRDQDLRDDYGQYFRVAEDRAIMLPMLEMCGTERARHISAPLMVYNQRPAEQIGPEEQNNVKTMESRAPYARLTSGFLVGS